MTAIMPTDREALLSDICQRIRAGWLPHRLASGGWWWGRPRSGDGFSLWSEGTVPSMSVVEPMTLREADAWASTLHAMAPENGNVRSREEEHHASCPVFWSIPRNVRPDCTCGVDSGSTTPGGPR